MAYGFMVVMLAAVLFGIASNILAGGLAFSEDPTVGMARPGGHCKVPLEHYGKRDWLPSELWAWKRICVGRDADFNEELKVTLDPKDTKQDKRWTDDRKLTADFIVMILLHEPFRSAIPYRGVRIVGAHLEDKIDLSYASIERPLGFLVSRFDSQVVLFGLTTPTDLVVDGSRFHDKLTMEGVSIGGALYMRNAVLGEVSLHGAKIGDRLELNKSEFKGKLNMEGVLTGGDLFMRDADFGEVNLLAAKVGSWLEMNESEFKGKLTMASVSIERHLFMQNAKLFGEVDLRAAKIGDQLNVHSSIFHQPTFLRFVNVGSNFDARGATLRHLDLTGASIAGELRLGSREQNIDWKDYTDSDGEQSQAPKLTLRNSSIGTLQDTEDTWPDHLEREFEGFTYDRLGGLGMSEQEPPYERGSDWFISWLAKDEAYSPQPYWQLAHVLRAAGHSDMANHILYANRERQRREYNQLGTSKWLHFTWWRLSALKIFIGYGYGLRLFLPLAWVAGFALMGTIFLAKENSMRSESKLELLGFWYSLDMLLPVIQLRERHYTDVDLITWVRYYFYIHKVIGYVLVFFVIAGLSGLAE